MCYPFDAAFVFAEVSHPPQRLDFYKHLCNCWENNQWLPFQVNSDVVFYSRGKDGAMQPVRVNQTHVGRMVLTKTAGATTRRDITDLYKFPEGSTQSALVWPGLS